jgi:hypothetical protein
VPFGEEIHLSLGNVSERVSAGDHGPDGVALNALDDVLKHARFLKSATKKAQIFEVQSSQVQVNNWAGYGT